MSVMVGVTEDVANLSSSTDLRRVAFSTGVVPKLQVFEGGYQ